MADPMMVLIEAVKEQTSLLQLLFSRLSTYTGLDVGLAAGNIAAISTVRGALTV